MIITAIADFVSGILKKIKRFGKKRGGGAENPADSDELHPVFERWSANFARSEGARFVPESGASFDSAFGTADGGRSALVLRLKKSSVLVWTEIKNRTYTDIVIEAEFCLKPSGAYTAAGLVFRALDGDTCYLALISSKGYFRLDVLRNGAPLALTGWTETASSVSPAKLTVIAYGNHIVLAVNGHWAAEINDSTLASGRIGFAAACYQSSQFSQSSQGFAAQAALTSFTVESRITEVAACYEKWEQLSHNEPRSHIALAETFTAMGQGAAALVQMKRAWESPGYVKTAQELLLAGRTAMDLGRFDDAQLYIEECIAMPENDSQALSITEKAKTLYAAGKMRELVDYIEQKVAENNGNPELWMLLGHGYFYFNEYEKAADAYDMAPGAALAAKSAANVYELLGRKDEALKRYLLAGNTFLAEENYDDLGNCVPKLLSLGAQNCEAHALAGKWAFGIENWTMAKNEFAASEKSRLSVQNGDIPPPDPALVFLQGLLLVREGKRAKALPLLEKAVSLAPDYPLFRFRLAENRFLLHSDPNESALNTDLHSALSLAPEDGWIANLAGQIALAAGDLESARRHLDKAEETLGEIPAIRVNRAVQRYLEGSLNAALETLNGGGFDDTDGIMANCAGNLLVREKRWEDADNYYRKALLAQSGNIEYLCNRSSCLIELGNFGEADELLARAHSIAPSPDILEQIGFVAAKKGEYQRAEAACRAALEMEPNHTRTMLLLGWIFAAQNRWAELEETIAKLESVPEIPAQNKELQKHLAELKNQAEQARIRLVRCSTCGRVWHVLRDPPAAPPVRLYAMPPDELPAGVCPECGGVYCIGCGKQSLDKDGRFLCPKCGKALKLTDDGLKQLVADWAAKMIPDA
ncbi:hypothetical protein FACS1894151_05670 [Spirochaetia bacterium]|nr:hypothetical protein FACS1894151_05670 [Spirochaetia bacterium]